MSAPHDKDAAFYTLTHTGMHILTHTGMHTITHAGLHTLTHTGMHMLTHTQACIPQQIEGSHKARHSCGCLHCTLR